MPKGHRTLRDLALRRNGLRDRARVPTPTSASGDRAHPPTSALRKQEVPPRRHQPQGSRRARPPTSASGMKHIRVPAHRHEPPGSRRVPARRRWALGSRWRLMVRDHILILRRRASLRADAFEGSGDTGLPTCQTEPTGLRRSVWPSGSRPCPRVRLTRRRTRCAGHLAAGECPGRGPEFFLGGLIHAVGDLGDRGHPLAVLASGTGTTRASAIAGWRAARPPPPRRRLRRRC